MTDRTDRDGWARMPAEEREAALGSEFRRRLAAVLRVSPDTLDLDAPMSGLHRVMADPRATYLVLRGIVEDLLGFLIYPVELRGVGTLAQFSRYLAGEVEPLPDPRGSPIADPYAGGEWAWGAVSDEPLERRLPGVTFVLSAPRCGSTLFRAMLDGHPELFSPPELNLLPFDRMGDRGRRTEELGYSWIRSGPAQAYGGLFDWDEETAQLHVGRLEETNAWVPDVYAELIHGAGTRHLVDKSPLYSLHPAWMRRAELWFDRPRYIFLLRHPYSVMESFVRMRFHRLLGPHWGLPHDHPWRLAERVWGVCNAHIAAFLSTVPEDRQLAVYYERLVSHPEEEGERVCAFLGTEYHPGVADPYAGGRQLQGSRFGRKALPTIGDPNILRHTGIDASLADWRRHRPPHPVGPFLRSTAAAVGYSLDE